VLAFFYLTRKFFLQSNCSWAISKKMSKTKDRAQWDHLEHIRQVTRVQQLVTFMRILASGAAAVSLPWALAAIRGWYFDKTLPLFITLTSVCIFFLTRIITFVIEYSVLYNLDPKLGEYVCVAFF
jgi:hypothetical protein